MFVSKPMAMAKTSYQSSPLAQPFPAYTASFPFFDLARYEKREKELKTYRDRATNHATALSCYLPLSWDEAIGKMMVMVRWQECGPAGFHIPISC